MMANDRKMSFPYVLFLLAASAAAGCEPKSLQSSVRTPAAPCEEPSVNGGLAELYFLDWDLLTVHRYEPEHVRQKFDVHLIEIGGEHFGCLDQFLDDGEAWSILYSEVSVDGRLLLTMRYQDGLERQYFASRFYICDMDQSVCRENNQVFKELIVEIVGEAVSGQSGSKR